MYEDKTLVCKECGAEFVFTAGEQEFYAEKGFVNEPLQELPRCPQKRCQAGARDAYGHLRELREGSEGSFQAPRGSPRLLQRVLRQHERRRLSFRSSKQPGGQPGCFSFFD